MSRPPISDLCPFAFRFAVFHAAICRLLPPVSWPFVTRCVSRDYNAMLDWQSCLYRTDVDLGMESVRFPLILLNLHVIKVLENGTH